MFDISNFTLEKIEFVLTTPTKKNATNRLGEGMAVP